MRSLSRALLVLSGLQIALLAQMLPAWDVIDQCGGRAYTSNTTGSLVYEDSACNASGAEQFKPDASISTHLWDVYSVSRTTHAKTLITTPAVRSSLGIDSNCSIGDPTISPNGNTLYMIAQDDTIGFDPLGHNCRNGDFAQQQPATGGGYMLITCAVPVNVTGSNCTVAILPGAYAAAHFPSLFPVRKVALGGGIDTGVCSDNSCLVWGEMIFSQGSPGGYYLFALTYCPVTPGGSTSPPAIGSCVRYCPTSGSWSCDVDTGAPPITAAAISHGCWQYVKPSSVGVTGGQTTIYYQTVLGQTLGTSLPNYCYNNGWMQITSGLASYNIQTAANISIWPPPSWGTVGKFTPAGTFWSYGEFPNVFTWNGETFLTLFTSLPVSAAQVDSNLGVDNYSGELGFLRLDNPASYWFVTDLNRTGSPMNLTFASEPVTYSAAHPTVNTADKVVCFDVRPKDDLPFTSANQVTCASLDYPGSPFAATFIMYNGELGNGEF